jgi:hypothetical protein
MQNVPDNIDLLLPYGELLRGFVDQPFISDADVKRTLRGRGIFLNRGDKADTIPVLACCLLSPREFERLQECHSTYEDNLKTMTMTLGWTSDKPLLEAIPGAFDLSGLVAPEFGNYKVIGSPQFVPVGNNPDNIACEFEIERVDWSRSWASTKSHFRGTLRIEKAVGNGSIKFVLSHTAEETKDLNKKLVQSLTRHFKDTGTVGRELEIQTIRFSSFDNEGRIAFFRSLTSGLSLPGFEAAGITKYGVAPDGRESLPSELRWMEDKIDDLRLNGKALEETFFIKNKKLHKHLLLYAVEAKFKFECTLAKGNCSIVFEFPDFGSKKDVKTEFEINVSSLTPASGCGPVNRTEVKQELLRLINDYKLLQLEKYRLGGFGDLEDGSAELVAARPASEQATLDLGAAG